MSYGDLVYDMKGKTITDNGTQIIGKSIIAP